VTIRGAPARLGTAGGLFWAQFAGGTVAALAALLVEGLPTLPGARAAAFLAVAAVGAVLAYGGLFAALHRGPVAVCAPIISAWSAVSVAIAWALGEDPGTTALVATALVLAGNVLLTRSSAAGGGSGTQPSRRALLAALASAAGFGVMVPAVDVVAGDVGRIWAVPWIWATQWALALPLLRLFGRVPRLPRGRTELARVALPGICEATGFVAASIGLGLAPLAAVAPASSLSTGITVILGVVVLRERLTLLASLGAAAASTGIVLVAAA